MTKYPTSALFLAPFAYLILLTVHLHATQYNEHGIPFPKVDVKANKENLFIAQSHTQGDYQNKNTTFDDTTSQTVPILYGDKLDEVAQWYGKSTEEFVSTFDKDKCLTIDDIGMLYYACNHGDLPHEEEHQNATLGSIDSVTKPLAMGNQQANNNNVPTELPPPPLSNLTNSIVGQVPLDTFKRGIIPPSMAFELESLPGANRTIYLDFDGHTTENTGWNKGAPERLVFTSPAIDFDGGGVGSPITDWEKTEIIKVWLQVAEHYAPFQVNVTTKEPPLDKLIKSSPEDQDYGIRVVITPEVIPLVLGSAGGIAYLNSFWGADDSPAFVFTKNLGNIRHWIARTTTHEVGHTLGLRHDGTIGNEYYYGTTNWAPIMGVARSPSLAQWSKGEYPNASNKEDDIAIMARHIPLREDMEAIPLHVNPMENSLFGRVGANNNQDIFILDCGKGDLIIQNRLSPLYPNLSLAINLYNKNNELIHSYTNNFTSTTSSAVVPVEAGRYFLKVYGPPVADAGNSSYGAIGHYELRVSQPNTRPLATKIELNRTNSLGIGDELLMVNAQTQDNENDPITLGYHWEASESPTTGFETLDGQTNSSINISQNLIGKYIRGSLTPSDDIGEGTSLKTQAIQVTSPIPTTAKVGQVLSYTIPSPYTNTNSPSNFSLLINEISKGYQGGQNPEWVEILLGEDLNLRGYKLSSHRNKTLIFSDSSVWEKVPRGTLITIYNGNEKDPLLPKDITSPQISKNIIASSTNTELFSGNWPELRRANLDVYYESDFEDQNLSKTSYAAADIVINGVTWNFDDALLGTSAGDIKEGLKSIRMRNNFIETRDFLPEGIGTVKFSYSRSNFTGDRSGTSPTFVVEYAHQNDPLTWIQIGQEINLLGVDTLTPFEESPEIPGKVKLRIRKIAGTNDKRYNIDNLSITPVDKAGFIEVKDQLGNQVTKLDFYDKPQTITPDFLKEIVTMSWQGGSIASYLNPQLWNSSQWTKPSPDILFSSISPGVANSQENQNFINSILGDQWDKILSYSFLEYPQHSTLQISPLSGHIWGAFTKPGRYLIKAQISTQARDTAVDTLENNHSILVTQSFEEKFKDKPGITNNPMGDDDNDGIKNIVEYALGLNPSSRENQNPLKLDLMYNENGKAFTLYYQKDIATEGYETIIEYSDDLINWSSQEIDDHLRFDNNGVEQRRALKNIDPLKKKVFVRLLVRKKVQGQAGSLSTNNQIVEYPTRAQGLVQISASAGTGTTKKTSLISLPLLGQDSTQPTGGTIVQVTGAKAISVNVGNSGLEPNSLSNPQSPYLVLITSGQAAGHMFLVSSQIPNTETEITLVDPLNAINDISNLGIENGNTFEIYPCDTLKSFFGSPEETLILGGNSPKTSDTIKLMSGSSFQTYYYNTDLGRWTRVGLGNQDASHTPLIPYQGLMFERLTNTPLEFYISGVVPTTKRVNLIKNSGITLLSNLYPIDTTLQNLGIHTMPNWRSSPLAKDADKVSIVTNGSSSTYFFDGTNWRRLSLGNPIVQNISIKTGSAIYITRANPLGGYTELHQNTPY